jgi:hypothetical protein
MWCAEAAPDLPGSYKAGDAHQPSCYSAAAHQDVLSLATLLGAQQLLADALAPHLPERVLSTLLTNTCGDAEMMCGPKLCSEVGRRVTSGQKIYDLMYL